MLYVIQYFNGTHEGHDVYRRDPTSHTWVQVWEDEKIRVLAARKTVPRLPVPADFDRGARNAYSTYAVEI
jgi:hypothetical protein